MRTVSHLFINAYLSKSSSIHSLVYTCDDSVVVPPKELRYMKNKIRSYLRITEVPDNIIGYFCIETRYCNDNPALCKYKKACQDYGTCEGDRESGEIYCTVFSYVAKQCRRQRVATKTRLYFKDIFGQYSRGLHFTSDGLQLKKFTIKMIQEGKRE